MMSNSSSPKKEDYILPNDTPLVLLECTEAFNELTNQEKHYAHYLSKAQWAGSLIVPIQTSPESPLIYVLLLRLFQSQSVSELKEVALNECNFTEEEFSAFLIYSCGALSNMANYKSFGDTKFIPNLPQEKFEKLIRSSKFGKKFPKDVERLLSNCLEKIFSLSDSESRLGFAPDGVTTYCSKNFTEDDDVIVKNFFKEQNFEPWNSRIIKTTVESGRNCYEIRLASTLQQDAEEDQGILGKYTIGENDFVITRGDYSPLLELVNWNLSLAKRYAANEHQEKMIEHYIHSFRTGAVKSHIDGSRFWVKDQGPVVESYVGFIEVYRDPSGVRGEFEGFVAVVNKVMSAKFATLVNAAENFIPMLPWPSTFEMDTFKRPDYTSLDVLTFAAAGIPAGINIPNYYDVKENDGFKNVSLANVLNSKMEKPNFLNKADQDTIVEYATQSMEVKVALHELLGHGSGKLLKEGKDGRNFDADKVVNFETNEKITSWYKVGDSYQTVFGKLSSAYEECRAECVALHLDHVPEILKIFDLEGETAEKIIYTDWLHMALAGLVGLQMYHPSGQVWLQAHSQARFAILNVMLEAGEDFVKLEETTGEDGKPDLLLTMDQSKIMSVGKPAMAKFLGRLQLYKSTADFQSAKEMFDKYTVVTNEGKHPFLNYRDIVMARRKPRKMFIQSNTVVEGENIVLKNYEASAEGMIKSYVDRFQDAKLYGILEDLWKKDCPHF